MPDDRDIAGIYPMLYGLFDADGALDRVAMAKQVESVVRSGAHGLAILGLATEVGKLVASRAQEAGVGSIVFDRGGFAYHGRVKALADAAREAGLEF